MGTGGFYDVVTWIPTGIGLVCTLISIHVFTFFVSSIFRWEASCFSVGFYFDGFSEGSGGIFVEMLGLRVDVKTRCHHFSCGYHAIFSISVATCTAYRMYLIPTWAGLPFFFVWGIDMIQLSFVLCFPYFFFPPKYSSTPELMAPVMRPRALYCGDELGSFLSENVFSIISKVWKKLEICINIRWRSVTIREVLQKQKNQVH